MPSATWNGQTIAKGELHDVEMVEGNVYFRREDVNAAFLRPSTHHTTCAWKGECSYYDVVVDGKVNANAAWFYPTPKEKAAHIKDRIAFWHGVQVTKS
jgi:uncharacterized protein (DUF427 family)